MDKLDDYIMYVGAGALCLSFGITGFMVYAGLFL